MDNIIKQKVHTAGSAESVEMTIKTVRYDNQSLEETMTKFASLAGALILGLLLAGCAGTTDVIYGENDAKAAIDAAKAANAKAKSVNYEWRDTGKMIKKAEEAAKTGKFEDAVKMAEKAHRQAKNAYAQYEANKNAGPQF